MGETRKLAAILVTDVVGFSRLASTDEQRTLARLRALRGDLVDPAVAAHHGRIVKGTGDGFIVEFRSVVEATRCAIEIQNGLIERNAGVPPERRIEFRIGIHAGEVVEESDGDLMGDAVNIAARLEGKAKPGAICLSEDAYRQVRGRLDMEVSALGATQLKNIAEPMRVYLVEVGKPADEPPKRRPAPPYRRVAALAALAILVVAGAVGWDSFAVKPSTTESSSAAPPSATESPAPAPTASLSGPAADVMPPTDNPNATPSTGNPATAPLRPQSQRQVRPAWVNPPEAQPAARKVARSPSRASSEPTQSAAAEGAAAESSQSCYLSAAQTNGNHVSCAYLHAQAPSAEPEPAPPVESASDSSRPCTVSAAQTNANHVPCAYLQGR